MAEPEKIPLSEITAELEPHRRRIEEKGIVDFDAFVELMSLITDGETRAYVVRAITGSMG